jgi:N-acetylmuramoyl-L-alanine amidase
MSLKFLSILFFCTTLTAERQFTIMLDPAGDGQYAGREIQDSFERGLTLQCAQEIKKQLTEQYSNIRVILTRAAGETIQPMHNALFANRLQVDVYLRIGFYHEPDMPSHIALFYTCNHPQDFWQTINPLQFFYIDQAYLLNLKLSKQLATNFLQILQNQQKNFITYGAFAAPFKPFIGIQAPALYLEAGLHATSDWKYIIKPVIQFMQTIAQASNGSL